MKRHEALVKLSRDHHFGLLTSWKIKQGIAKEAAPERISQYVLSFYNTQLEEHFAEEERWVFPLLGDDDLVKQAITEHNEMKQMVSAGFDAYPQLSDFGTLLEKHIRMEERELFPKIQEAATDEQLEDLLKKPFAEHGEMPWDDEFWK